MAHTEKQSPEPEPGTRVTVFTIPRAFAGEDKIRQENTLGSWTRLVPRPEIILFCDDPGVAEAAEQFNCVHVPDVRCNEGGIPFVGDAFRLASQLATNSVLCYANADIIFMQDFITAIDVVARSFDQPFLIVGQRWNVSVPEPLKFAGSWQKQLRTQARRRGNLHPPCAIDYFVYSQGAIVDMPDFLVGSPKWDNWVVNDAKQRGLQIVNATQAITCIHQQHRHAWPAEGIQHNQRLFHKFGGGTGQTHSGSWTLSAGAKLSGKAWVASARPKHGQKHGSARPRAPTRPRPPRPARVIPRDELGLPLNLNVPVQELVSSAKRLRRQAKRKTPARKKHSHLGPTGREVLLAERARLRQIQDTIRAACVAARDARIARRRGKRAR